MPFNTPEKRKAYSLQYRTANREKLRDIQRVWWAKNRDKQLRVMRAYNVQKRYGITMRDFEALLAKQDGRCAICHTDKPYGRGRFHIDHDHSTGKVRGILCHRCNTTLGWVERYNSWDYVKPLHPSVLD